MRRPVPAEINAPFERAPGHERRCQHPGCPVPGAYRAPVARDRLNEFYWFCIEHVREYNLAWDFFAGMSEEEIEYQRRADTVWQRPSWPFGQFGERAGRGTGYRVHDGFGFYSEDTQSTGRQRPQSEEQKALALLDLKEPVHNPGQAAPPRRQRRRRRGRGTPQDRQPGLRRAQDQLCMTGRIV